MKYLCLAYYDDKAFEAMTGRAPSGSCADDCRF